jgi:ribosomal protein S4
MKKQQDLFSTEEYKKTFVKNKKVKEESIQLQVCDYLRKNYPNVIFTCDLASGLKLPIWIAAKHKKMRSSRGLPDLFIAHVRLKLKSMGDSEHEHVTGLFIELKKDSARLKNGGIAKSDHHDEQEAILSRLRQQGYRAEFACGYEEAVKLIDEYLS